MSRVFLKDRLPRTYDPARMGDLMAQLEQFLNRLDQFQGVMSAAPTTGPWVRGDWVILSSPSAGGFWGSVCVATGSPGTWKSFGEIAP